jgi:glycosyltransferase involved in cell wall biosynthesis
MSKIILDCDLMRFRNSGLYHYCLNLGSYVNKIFQQEGQELVKFYVPPSEANAFGSRQHVIVEDTTHRFFKPFLWNCKLWHAPFQSGRILPKNPSIKVLLTIHDLNALHEGKPINEQAQSLAHTQALISRSDAIVCISEFTKSDVLKNCDVGNKPVYVVHNGTHAVGQPALHSASYHPSRPFLFGMGYVNRKKNFDVLVPLLVNTEFELLIAGRLDEPDYITQMKQHAETLDVSDRLHVLGPVSEEEKAWYLKNCKAFVLPSLAEGFGAPVVEAMQFGKALFLSNRTSLPEIAGDAAFYFDDFEPENMREVLSMGFEKYHQNGMADRIIQRGKEFDWYQKAKEYAAIYQSLI